MTEWWNDFFDADYIRVYERQDELAEPEADFVRKTLGLRRGQRVLDVCCGYGRHARPLAQAGLQVTGFDLSRYFLRKARRDARKAKLPINWVEGDVREMAFEPIFDAAINMFTSFGFFPTEEENFQLIRRSARALSARYDQPRAYHPELPTALLAAVGPGATRRNARDELAHRYRTQHGLDTPRMIVVGRKPKK